MPPAARFVLKVSETAEPSPCSDVLVGDVWLASGQSNMEWPLSDRPTMRNRKSQARTTADPAFQDTHVLVGKPETRLAGGQWQAASPQTVGEFSAVGLLLRARTARRHRRAHRHHQQQLGRQPLEAWIDAAMLGLDAQAIARQAQELQARDQSALDATRTRLARWPQKGVDTSRWNQADFDDRDWDRIAVPGLWEGGGYNGMDGEGLVSRPLHLERR